LSRGRDRKLVYIITHRSREKIPKKRGGCSTKHTHTHHSKKKNIEHTLVQNGGQRQDALVVPCHRTLLDC
jgi:hypothetical protein